MEECRICGEKLEPGTGLDWGGALYCKAHHVQLVEQHGPSPTAGLANEAGASGEAEATTNLPFSVRILNETLGIGEKIARIGSIEGASFFREASLSIIDDEIRLSCTDDVGGSHDLGSLRLQRIKRIRLKKSVFTPGQQLIKPTMNGAVLGVVVAVVAWFQIDGRPGTPIGDSPILVGIGVALFITALFVVLNLGKVVWENLAVVVFESDEGTSVEVAIENAKADALIARFAERNIPVGPL